MGWRNRPPDTEWASEHYRKWGEIMGKRRGFLPPAICEECKNAPLLGEYLWPDEKWRCFSCLEKSLPGEGPTSKSMQQMLEYGRESSAAFELESQGKSAHEPKSRAEWAKAIAGEVAKRHEARSKEVHLANGEAIPSGAESITRHADGS